MALAELLNDRTKQSFVDGQLHIMNVATHYDLKGKIKEIVIDDSGVNVILSQVTIKVKDRIQRVSLDDFQQPICQNELAGVEQLANGVRVKWSVASLTAELLRPH